MEQAVSSNFAFFSCCVVDDVLFEAKLCDAFGLITLTRLVPEKSLALRVRVGELKVYVNSLCDEI